MAAEPIYEVNESVKNINNITLGEGCFIKIQVAASGIQSETTVEAPFGKVIWNYKTWKSIADINGKEIPFHLKNKITGDIITKFEHNLTAQQATDLFSPSFPSAAVSILKDVLGLTSSPTVYDPGPPI